ELAPHTRRHFMPRNRMDLSSPLTRRRLLSIAGGSLTAGAFLTSTARRLVAAEQKAESHIGRDRVSSIEVHPIMVPYQDWIQNVLQHFYGPTHRVIYVVHTESGLIGLGEGHGREPDEVLEKYIGTSPFDWIGDETSLSLGTAMYDLMGQLAGVPVAKLFGQRQRQWVPVGSWTVSAAPSQMAEAVRQYSQRGYTWLKFHLSPFENVLDQLEAMEKVAPRGFRVLFDLTSGGTDDNTQELLDQIAQSPLAGAFEDPLNTKNIEEYATLRQHCRLPILLHHSPLQFTFDVLRRAADGYILGHAKIGLAMRRAGLMEAAQAPFMLQNVGGLITRTMTTHMQSVFPTAYLHTHSDAETWKDDVVNEQIEPVNGLVRVPNRPGLGVTLNREALDRLKNLKLPAQPKWIIKSEFANGTKMYNIADPEQNIFMVRPDVRKLIPMSYQSPISTTWWDDDGTPEYRAAFQRIEQDGIILER
ncbi:MAG: mandelate racemase/muconate lactonizing enzyme family protein, partial [Planctomycetaceae bacterium]